MYKATALLQEDDRKVFEVAKSVAYDSDASFSKAFKRVWGIAQGDIGEARPNRAKPDIFAATVVCAGSPFRNDPP